MKTRIFGIFLLVVLFVFSLAACGSDNAAFTTERQLYGGGAVRREVAEMAPMAPPAPAASAVPEDSSATWGAAFDSDWVARSADSAVDTAYESGGGNVDWEDIAGQGERHIIQNAGIELETEDFDSVVSELRLVAPSFGGYVESEILSARGVRMFTIVLRVPVAEFEPALARVESLADVRFLNQRAEDVTERFYDIVGNLETRRIEEERILALIEEAVDIQDLLVLETRLSNTRLSIDLYISQLTNMAGLIAFSTINVTLVDISEEEIIIATPSLGERIGGAFGDSVDGTINALQNFIVLIAGAILPLLLIAAIVLAGIFVARRVRRKVKASGV